MTRLILKLVRLANIIPRYVAARQSWMQAVAGVVGLTLGYWGWGLKFPAQDVTGHVNNLFRTIQLITLQFPTNFDGTIPWQLHVARLAVPLVAALATLNVLVGAITRPVRLALLPGMKDHVVVCGDSTMTEQSLITLAERGVQVVAVSADILDTRRDTLEGYGLTVIQADPFDPATMAALNLAKAGAIFLTQKEDMANLNLAVLAIEAAKARSPQAAPLTLAVMIEGEELARELDFALDGLSRQHGVRYHRISSDREGARLELERYAPALTKADRHEPSHVLVVGLSGGWSQVLSQAVIAAQDHPHQRPLFTLIVDEAEEAAFESWRETKPDMELVASFNIVRGDDSIFYQEEDASCPSSLPSPPHLAIILRPDEAALTDMLALRRPGNPYGIETAPILVRLSREDKILGRLAQTRLSDRDLSRVTAFGGMIRAEMIERVLDGKGDRLAMAMHEHYLAASHNLASQKAGEGASATQAAWNDLPENLRDANRASTAHAPILFSSAGFRLEESVNSKAGNSKAGNSNVDRAKSTLNTDEPASLPPAFSEAEMQWLARVEHKRWCADRIDRGWRFAPARNDRLKLHPSLTDFDELPEHERQKDRDAVLALVAILAAENTVIVRQDMPGQNALKDETVKGKTVKGKTVKGKTVKGKTVKSEATT